MTTFLFIGNLNFTTTNDQLLLLLSKYGENIKCKITIDRFTQKSKGFAHAEVENKETAEKIIKELRSIELDGRQLKIEYFDSLQTS